MELRTFPADLERFAHNLLGVMASLAEVQFSPLSFAAFRILAFEQKGAKC